METGKEYGSKLFETFWEIWKVKRTEICYSGDWKIHVNVAMGMMRKCLTDKCPAVCIFDDIEKPIMFEVIGNNCMAEFCWNGNAYWAVGVIPEVFVTSYGEMFKMKKGFCG